jgi:hypothetical protein
MYLPDSSNIRFAGNPTSMSTPPGTTPLSFAMNANYADYALNILQRCESNIHECFMGRKIIKVNSQ